MLSRCALLASVLAAASAAPQVLVGGHVPVVAARAAGQVSHQSVTRPGQEVRSLVQSKPFGSAFGSSSQVDNSKGLTEAVQPALGAAKPVPVGKDALHAAPLAVAHAAPVHVAHAAPVAVAHAAPVHVAHAAPVHVAHHAAPVHVAHATPVAVAHHAAPVHVAHAAPVHVAHAAPLVKAVAHPVAGYAAVEDLAEISPYNFNYAVADDYSGSAFTATETSDGLGAKTGSYKVALPDGRTQTVTYTTDDVNGYVAEVTYEGVPQYPEAPVVKAAPVVVAHAPVAHTVAHAPVAHAVAHAPITHAVAHHAPVLAHAVPVHV